MNNEEFEMYQKAVNYIVRNIDNPMFSSILRQHGYKIIPCKLSYVIENLEKAGFTVSKKENIIPTDTTNNQNNKEELLSFIKNRQLSLYALIKDTTIYINSNKVQIIFNQDSFFKYKQCSEINNKQILSKLISEFLNQDCILDLSIKKENP